MVWQTMKMIKTPCGLMTLMEAKIIGDITRDEKKNHIKCDFQKLKVFDDFDNDED